MDAQNAAESDQTKPPVGASMQQKERQESEATATDITSTVKVDSQDHDAGDSPSATEDRDSEAETIVLPGQDGHSPSKVRKVRQEDRSDGDGDAANGRRAAGSRGHHAPEEDSNSTGNRSNSRTGLPAASTRRRLSSSMEKSKDNLTRTKDGGSSGLSSAPTSPPQHHSRRRSVNSRRSSYSDSDQQNNNNNNNNNNKRSSLNTILRDKLKSGERLTAHKRKASRTDSDEEDESRKIRRPRAPSTGYDNTRPSREQKASAPKHDARNRSTSPPARSHRRSASTQLPSQPSNGALKKRRLPPPLQSTEHYSDESSASGSPHPRHTKTRSLATPALHESAISPAKMPSHKKHLDAHGQTYLARACARGDYDSAKSKLSERPEDLNVADYAGNTPLQIAAINGCENIVKLLIDAGCNLDCVNYDKDTPLLDAVDNGHLGVVRLLIDAGVNPRKANVSGEEPIDRVTDEIDNADEIREILIEAKKRFGGRTKTSEERYAHLETDGRDSHAPDSPRQSPAMSSATGRRAGTVRSTKTRNDLLYMPLDEKTLRQAAGRGDEETVARVLQVKDGCDDAESMVAAARGGHDFVIQLLLGLGGAQADPDPVASQPEEFATPILAAIGQENLKVLELLLNQQEFNPTRRYKGETYYEIAKRRQGTNWKEEEEMLKKAYDAYKTSHKSKVKSPGRSRDRDRDDKRSRREDRARHSNSSPTRENDGQRKASSSKLASPRERRKAEISSAANAEDALQKRGLTRPRKDDMHPSANPSDRELSPTIVHKPIKAKRTESDVAAMSSEGEAVKPRRKLVSKGELRGEREKQRRSSMASNASSLRDPPSPQEVRHEEAGDKAKLSEKYHDRAKALKRDESRDRLGTSADSAPKRHRSSLTPDRHDNGDKDDGELPVKRRRLESGSSEKRQKRASSSDSQNRNSASGHDNGKLPTKPLQKKERSDSKSGLHEKGSQHKGATHTVESETPVLIKSEDVDVEMPDIASSKDSSSARQSDADEERRKRKVAKQAQEDEEKKRLELEDAKQAEEKKKRREQQEEETRRKEEEEKLKREAERQKKEEEEAARQKQEEEEEREKRRLAEEKARLEAEEKARAAEEKKRLEEERRKEEEERRKKQEQEEKARKEREAAEEARRKQEEEERERRERAHREELDRKRAAREAEQRRVREEQDRIRLDSLPPLLRWLNICKDPKSTTVAESLKTMQGVRYDCIRPEANRTAEGREQWVLNTHVALLLGEKDLDLSRYTDWERAPVSSLAKTTLWRIEAGLYSLTDDRVIHLGRQLPGYYGNDDPAELSFQAREHLRSEAWKRFSNMDLFFVKVSDLMYTIPSIPHLRNVKLAVTYRELIENESQMAVWRSTQKWKQDPDANRFGGYFAPRNKYYLNGAMIDEDRPTVAETSKSPFPEKRVPRRGLLQVMPDDPDYARICIEQGLQHLLMGHKSPSVPNGVHTPPASHADLPIGHALGPEIEESKEHDGPGGSSHAPTNGSLTNGINGSG